MKKYSSLVIFVFLSIFLLSACSFPFIKAKLEPFEKGVLDGENYYNNQAKIKFAIPLGWDAKVAKDAQEQVEDTLKDADVDTDEYTLSTMDFTCQNPNTGSTLSISYAPKEKSKEFDENVDDIIDYVIEKGKTIGITYVLTDSFDETIAGRKCRVDVLEMTYLGIDMREYACFFEIDSYLGMIIIVPNDFIDEGETFEAIIANFSEIE